MHPDNLSLYVWRGSGGGRSAPAVIPTGFAALDRELPGGGWPQGAITEICTDRYGIGELTVLMPALVRLSRQEPVDERQWIIWLAPPLLPYAPALRGCGLSLERLLVIRPSASAARRTAGAAVRQSAVGAKDCLWAAEQVIRSGSSLGVLAWLPAADRSVLRRLQLAAEEQRCWVVLFREPEALLTPSPAALRIRLGHTVAAMRVEIVKCRGGRPVVVDIAVPLKA